MQDKTFRPFRVDVRVNGRADRLVISAHLFRNRESAEIFVSDLADTDSYFGEIVEVSA